MLATLAIVQLSNAQQISFVDNLPSVETATSAAVTTYVPPKYEYLSYINGDGALIEVKEIQSSRTMTNEVNAVAELVAIGALVFKDSRNITADEAAIVHSVYKKKFSKI